MLDDDVADMGGQRGQYLDQLEPLGGRQACCWFVEQDETRRPGQRERDLELALLADGGQVHGLYQRLRRMHKRVVPARPQQREASARNAAAGEIDVVLHGKPSEQRGNLVGAAQAAADALIGREMRDVLAEEADGAGGGREVPGDAIEQRGLAGAVGPEHGAPLTRAHGDGDVGERGQRAEHARDAAQLERGSSTDHRKSLRNAIHGRPLRFGRGQHRCAASAPTGRSRHRTTRTRWRGSRARSATGSGCRPARAGSGSPA
jgi:hypothetical protein